MTLERTKKLSDNSEIVYQVVSPPVPFVSDRDMYLFCHKKKNGDGNYTLFLYSIPSCPEVEKKVRAVTFIAWIISEMEPGKCVAVGFSSINPMGSIPGILANKMSKAAGKSAQKDKENIEKGVVYDASKKK